MKYKILLFVLSIGHILCSQNILTISQIQGKNEHSPYINQTVTTTGVVTAMFIGQNTINGFFIQDKNTDPHSSSAIFVYSPNNNNIVDLYDEIEISGKVAEYKNRTQLSSVEHLKIIEKGVHLEPIKINYNINNWDWERYEGMLIEFEQTLWVNNNYYLERYGELELGVKRRPSPTNIAFPGSTHYVSLLAESEKLPIYIDDAYTSNYVTPIVFADEYGTRRTGERVDNLRAVVDQVAEKYVLYPVGDLEFYGNPRSFEHPDIGDYNVKVCSFNLEYYLTSPNNSTMGPSSQEELNRQHTKILAALLAIDADIYALQEVEQGQHALRKLVNDLNKDINNIKDGKSYQFIDDGTVVNGTFTKVGYIYRTDKISTHKDMKSLNSPTPINRKKMQAFTLNSNGERFILSVNHFKAKSGCQNASGADIDFGDGQSCFNAKRVAEANAVINAAVTNTAYYGDEDVLVVGDLNSYAKEDPIQTFIQAGYVDLITQFGGEETYSYVYRTEAGTLDHALANKSMAAQVTGAAHFHINADELASFGYDGSKYEANMFRCSDHDPIVIGLSLGKTSNNINKPFNERVQVFPTVINDVLNINNAEGAVIQIYTIDGVKAYQSIVKSNSEMLNFRSKGLIKGFYILKLMGENRVFTQVVAVK